MKVKTLSVLAGASALAISAAAVAQIDYAVTNQFGSTAATEADSNIQFSQWHEDNGYQTATITLTGLPAGVNLVGLLGTGLNPWSISTTSENGFHNAAQPPFHSTSSIFSAKDVGEALSNEDLIFDSGLLGEEGFGDIVTGIGENAFTTNGGGANEGPLVGAAISLNPEGIPNTSADATTLDLFQITWDEMHGAQGAFLFALADGTEQAISWSVPAIPAPGALALLGLAGLAGARRRRA